MVSKEVREIQCSVNFRVWKCLVSHHDSFHYLEVTQDEENDYQSNVGEGKP